MARDKFNKEFHPKEYDPDFPRLQCIKCGYMNSCKCESSRMVPRYPRLPILMMGGMVESVVHDDGSEINISPITQHALKSIRDSEFTSYPSKRLKIENIIEEDLLLKIKENWPNRGDMREEPIGRFQINNFNFNKYYQQFYDDVINNVYVKCAIIDKLVEEVELGTPNISLWEDTNNFSVNDVHIDYGSFYVTLGIFLPDDDSTIEYGTEFWDPYKFSDNRDETFTKQECDLIERLPFKQNTGYVMVSDSKSYHASPDINKDIIRKHIYVSYPKI